MPVPSGFVQHTSGFWMRVSDTSGPFFFDGTNMVAVALSGNPYPVGATSLSSSSGNVANASAVATLAAAAAQTTYITGLIITGAGATAASVVLATLAGIIGGTATLVYPVVAGATSANQPLIVTFPAAIPASAVNTAIVLTLPALGAGNTNASVSAFGYRL